MSDEKYTISLIDSIEQYIHKLQYLAYNKRTTLRALNTYKIFHWLYEWADYFEVSEEDKLKIEELMNCLILRNSNLILPAITPQSFYSNVSSPQNMWTWRIIYDDSNSVPPPPPPSNKILTIQAIQGGFGVLITSNVVDENDISSGTTEFTLEYPTNQVLTLTAPMFLSNGNIFDHWTVDGVAQTPTSSTGLSSLIISMNTNHTAVAIYRLAVPPIGSIQITKEIYNQDEEEIIDDYTEFTIILSKNNVIYTSGKVKYGTPLIFSNLEMGTYKLTETPIYGYVATENPKVTTLSYPDDITKSITFRNITETSTEIIYGTVTARSLIDGTPRTGVTYQYDLFLDGNLIQSQWGTEVLEATFSYVLPGTYTLKSWAMSPNDDLIVIDAQPNDPLGSQEIGYFIIDINNLNQEVTFVHSIYPSEELPT